MAEKGGMLLNTEVLCNISPFEERTDFYLEPEKSEVMRSHLVIIWERKRSP